jgi:hypothetical protein
MDGGHFFVALVPFVDLCILPFVYFAYFVVLSSGIVRMLACDSRAVS